MQRRDWHNLSWNGATIRIVISIRIQRELPKGRLPGYIRLIVWQEAEKPHGVMVTFRILIPLF